MFSSRNIHFAVLGLILGASAGYVLAFYNAEVPAEAPAAANSGLPANHPDLNSPETLDFLRKAAEENAQQPEILARYANALFSAGRFEDALEWYGKVLAIQPDNLDVRSVRGAVYWRLGRMDEAMADLQAALQQDPNHLPTLYGLFLLTLNKGDVARAAQVFRKIESIDPNYEGLPELKARLEEERRKRSN